MFEEKQVNRGKARVPICFPLNGRKTLMVETAIEEGTDRVFLDYDKPLYPYISMTKGCCVLAKMCSRETGELTKKVTKLEESWEETNRKLDLFQMCSRENAHAEQGISKTEDLIKNVPKLEESLEETNRKLDTLLSRLTHQEQSG